MQPILRFLAIAFVILNVPVFGQSIDESNWCGTEPTQAQIEYLNRTRSLRQEVNQQKSAPKTTLYIPVQHHIVRRSNGTGGLTPSAIPEIMHTLNHYYGKVNMIYFECGPINFIDDDTYYDFSSSQESAVCGANDVTDVINIYYFNSAKSGSNSVCGYSRFPPSVDRVIMANSCATNGSTIVHELGHYFSLYHTHGKTNFGTTSELVDGSNCSNTGDDICDTPADPNLSGKVSSLCRYTGTGTDINGDAYNPQVDNIMSYSRKACRQLMTTQQLNRALASLQVDRSYLICPTPTVPVADFWASTSESCDGLVNFTDRSSSIPTQWAWDFGDGNGSTMQHPVHQYRSSGTYTVTLIVANSSGSNTATQTNTVVVTLLDPPTVDPVDSICEGQLATLSGTGTGVLHWYADTVTDVPLSMGNTYLVSGLTTTTTFYVADQQSRPAQKVGMKNNLSGSGGYTTAFAHLVFDAHKPFTLKTVKVYADSAKERTIELRDHLGLVLQDTTIMIAAGEQTVTLDFDVPAASNLELGLSVVSEMDLYRNTSGASYPYSVSGIMDITGSSSGSAQYYYFYDWQILEGDCKSLRVPVTVGVKACFDGVSTLQGLSKIELRPNPTNGLLYLANNDFAGLNVSVYNMVGAEVYNEQFFQVNKTIDLTHLPDGVYLFHLNYHGSQVVKKLVKAGR